MRRSDTPNTMRFSLLAGSLLLAASSLAGCSDEAGEASETAEVAAEPAIHFQRVSEDLVEHGDRVATILACKGCHTPDLTGQEFAAPDILSLWPANLTRVRENLTDEQLAHAITGGENPERALWIMPSVGYSQLGEEDMAALIAYIRSVPGAGEDHPDPQWFTIGQQWIDEGKVIDAAAMVAEGGEVWPADAGEEHAFGRYVARNVCSHCHGPDLRGGRPNPQDGARRPDLRIAAAYSLEDFTTLMRTGIAAGGREVGLMTGVAQGALSSMTDEEINALHAYLVKLGEIDP